VDKIGDGKMVKVRILGPNGINFGRGAMHVHAPDCRDIKQPKYHWAVLEDRACGAPWILDAKNADEIVDAIYSDHYSDWDLSDEEGRKQYGSDVDIFPCVKGLEKEEPKEQPKKAEPKKVVAQRRNHQPKGDGKMNLRKAAKNVVAGDLMVIDNELFEARRNAKVLKGIALIPMRLAHVGKGRLREFQMEANKQIHLAQVGDAFVAA